MKHFRCLWLLLLVSPLASGEETLRGAYADVFQMGVAVNRNTVMGRTPGDAAVVVREYGLVVAENDMKWQVIHPREGAGGFDFGPADAVVAFARKNGLAVAGHTLVWHGQTPDWVFENATREVLLARMREHIHTVVGRYKGQIQVWDVVNEAISDKPGETLRSTRWLEIIGPDFIEKAFEYAHEADPDAVLRYNDYGLENPVKRAKVLALVKGLLEKKVPIMAIGSQTHVGATRPTVAEMDLALTELGSLGLPVHITELDVNGAEAGQQTLGADISNNAAATEGSLIEAADARQAEQYGNLFRLFVKHKESVKMVTFWGVNDGVSWRAKGRPLLFDVENGKKAAYQAVMGVRPGKK